MTCWMCRGRKVKSIGRCKTCQETRCIECGHELMVFVRTIHATKFRKKQWKTVIYEHRTIVKTRTFEKLCVNPECPKRWDSAKLPPAWLPVPKLKAPPNKKTIRDAIAKVEEEVASL